MIIELKDTTAAQIATAMLKARRQGSTSGLAFTLVVVTDAQHYKKVLQACLEAGREHPSRILVVVNGRGERDALDAELRTGESIPGDVVTLRVNGALVDHSASIVLPLLLPDSPTVVWWPNVSPTSAAEDQLGALATRRITDASGDGDALHALRVRAENHSPGDTDLTWTRLTPWRALLAAALDQYPARILHATVEAARDNAPAELMAAWLEARLGVEVKRKNTKGPGISGIRLATAAGDIEVLRGSSAAVALYSVPGQPKRMVALKRRDINELITEELRRMDADDIFEESVQALRKRWDDQARAKASAGESGTGARTTARKTTAAKTTAAKSTATKTGAAKTTAAKSTAKKSSAKPARRKASAEPTELTSEQVREMASRAGLKDTPRTSEGPSGEQKPEQ